MHILYIHQHFTTPSGSSGTRSYEFAKRLVTRGHKATMLCGSFGVGKTGLSGPAKQGIRRGMVDGIEVIEICVNYSNNLNFLSRTLAFVSFALKSCKVVLKEPYDLLFATSTPLTIAIPGIVGKLFRRKPFVFEVRDLWPELPKAMGVIKNPLILFAMGLLEKYAYRLADSCVALSPGIQQGITKICPGKTVVMVPNGSDIDLFKPSLSPKPSIEGVNDGDFVAVYTGAHGIANGLENVLDVAQHLRVADQLHIKFVFVGAGIRKESLVERAKSQLLTNCIFLDPISKTDLAQMLPNCHVGIMPLANVPAFYYGTSPNKFFDYIASGLAVINNYPGWLADMIGKYECGIAVEPDSPEAFAKALLTLAESKDLLLKYRQNARALAENHFSRNILAKEFISHLESYQRTNTSYVQAA